MTRRFSRFAARGPLQTAAAVQYRRDAGGQRKESFSALRQKRSNP